LHTPSLHTRHVLFIRSMVGCGMMRLGNAA
jgi:hypothetical protein